MTGATRQIVTVEVEGMTLAATVALYQLLGKLVRQHGVSDVYEVECSLIMSATNFAAPNEADVDGLIQALDDLRIDAQVTEVVL